MSGTPGQWLKGAIFLLLAFMIRFSALTAENSEILGADFRFHGKPVHPLLVKQFEPWISDARPPITVEVNLTAAWDSNEYSRRVQDGFQSRCFHHLPERATYAYQHLGTLRDGTHVLRTFDSGGGRGCLRPFCSCAAEPAWPTWRTELSRASRFSCRCCDATRSGIVMGRRSSVKQDHVVVGKSRYRENPVVLKFGKADAPEQTKIQLEETNAMTEADYISKLKDFEGFTNFMYLDSRANVTIGVGILLANAGAAKGAGIAFKNRKTNKTATPDDIEKEFNTIKAAPRAWWKANTRNLGEFVATAVWTRAYKRSSPRQERCQILSTPDFANLPDTPNGPLWIWPQPRRRWP